MEIDNLLNAQNYNGVLSYCKQQNMNYTYLLLSKIFADENLIKTTSNTQSPLSKPIPKTRIQIYCNWCSSEDLCKLWEKMSKGNCEWDGIVLISNNEKPDYYVVINCPPIGINPPKEKTIIFQMEPNMNLYENQWGEWANPKGYLKVFSHDVAFNNNEWHLSKTYNELINEKDIQKNEGEVISVILSDKYRDLYQIKRIDFVKYLESEGFKLDVYGGNRFNYKNYKGTLPSHCKDNGLLPYKYTFNCENNVIKNYYTEKLIDGILCECLCFYCGAPNISELIDERAYVKLDLNNFSGSVKIIKQALSENWWEKRIEFIRKEKKRILNELQFFPRLENYLRTNELKILN